MQLNTQPSKQTVLKRLISRIEEGSEDTSQMRSRNDSVQSNRSRQSSNQSLNNVKQKIDLLADKKMKQSKPLGNSTSLFRMSEQTISVIPEAGESPTRRKQDSQHQSRKVLKLVRGTKHRLGTEKIASEEVFYKKNLKSFEGVDTFINSKTYMSTVSQYLQDGQRKNAVLPVLTVQPVSIYADHLDAQEQIEKLEAKQESLIAKKIRQKKQEEFFIEYRAMFWEATNDHEKTLFDNESMNRYNDFKYLVYLEKFLEESQAKQLEKRQNQQMDQIKDQIDLEKLKDIKAHLIKSLMNDSSIRNDSTLRFDGSDGPKTDHLNIQDQLQGDSIDIAQEFKNQSDKVLALIRSAAKKIFNKKQDDIRREQLQAKAEQQKRKETRMKMHQSLQKSVHQPRIHIKPKISEFSLPQINTHNYITEPNSVMSGSMTKQKSRFYMSNIPSPAYQDSDNDEVITNLRHMIHKKHNSQPSLIQSPRKKELRSVYEQRKLNKSKIQGLLGSLLSLQEGNKVEHDRLKVLSKERSQFATSLEKMTKPGSIKETLIGLFEHKRTDYDLNFYNKIKKSFKKQLL